MKENMFKKTILIVILSCLAVACTTIRLPVQKTPLQKELASGAIPRFDGYVSPITIPIRPMYKPAVSDVKLGIAWSFSFTEKSTTKKEDLPYVEMTGKQKIEKAGDMLVWDITFDKWMKRGKIAPVELGVRLLTDLYGKVQEVEVIAPDVGDKKEQDGFAEIMKLRPVFSETSVRSGDPIIQQASSKSESEIYQLISQYIFDTPPNEGSVEFSGDLFKDNQNLYITKGWSFFNGRKVVVANINDFSTGKMVIAEESEGIGITLKFNVRSRLLGYILFDAETFQVVDNKLLSVFEMNAGSLKFALNILSHRIGF